MALHGYAGKILHLDMTAKKANPVPTEKYRRWGGGHGLGSALFWDFCKDKTIKDGRNPANVVCVCSSPLTGTIAPSAGGRCDVVGRRRRTAPAELVHALGIRRPVLDDAQVRRMGCRRHHRTRRQADVGRGGERPGDVPRRRRHCGARTRGLPSRRSGSKWGTPAGRRRRPAWKDAAEVVHRRADDAAAGGAVHRARRREPDGAWLPGARRRQRRRPGRLRRGLGIEEPEGDCRHRHRARSTWPIRRRC